MNELRRPVLAKCRHCYRRFTMVDGWEGLEPEIRNITCNDCHEKHKRILGDQYKEPDYYKK